MNFVNLVLFMMNMTNKTMQREINDYIKNVKKEPIKYGKSAMSKARLKISPELFVDLDEGMLEDICAILHLNTTFCIGSIWVQYLLLFLLLFK